MVATVRIASGKFKLHAVPGAGRCEKNEDGGLDVLGTDMDGGKVTVWTYEAGEWSKAWLQNEGQPEQFGHVTAGT